MKLSEMTVGETQVVGAKRRKIKLSPKDARKAKKEAEEDTPDPKEEKRSRIADRQFRQADDDEIIDMMKEKDDRHGTSSGKTRRMAKKGADNWWGRMSDDQKKKYLEKHPNSHRNG